MGEVSFWQGIVVIQALLGLLIIPEPLQTKRLLKLFWSGFFQKTVYSNANVLSRESLYSMFFII